MLAVQIKLDEKSIAEAQHILRAIPRAWPRVARASLRAAVVHSRAVLSRIVKSRISSRGKGNKANIGDIKKYLHIDYPTTAKLRTALYAETYSKPLIDLDPQQTDAGVTYRLPFGGGRQLLRHAFIATGESRGRQVWLRSRYYIGRVKRIDWRGRNIEAIYAQRAPGLDKFIKAEDMKRLGDEGVTRLQKEIVQRTGYMLKRWNKR
jgi:hypothetical protein